MIAEPERRKFPLAARLGVVVCSSPLHAHIVHKAQRHFLVRRGIASHQVLAVARKCPVCVMTKQLYTQEWDLVTWLRLAHESSHFVLVLDHPTHLQCPGPIKLPPDL